MLARSAKPLKYLQRKKRNSLNNKSPGLHNIYVGIIAQVGLISFAGLPIAISVLIQQHRSSASDF
jgi:hypothetical protein